MSNNKLVALVLRKYPVHEKHLSVIYRFVLVVYFHF